MRTFQKRSDPGVLRNPQTSAQLSGIDPGYHNGVGPGGVGKAQSAKASSKGTDVVSIAAPPRCPVDIACNQVNMLTKHDGTDCENELLRNTPFFGVDIVKMLGQNCEGFLAAKGSSAKRST